MKIFHNKFTNTTKHARIPNYADSINTHNVASSSSARISSIVYPDLEGVLDHLLGFKKINFNLLNMQCHDKLKRFLFSVYLLFIIQVPDEQKLVQICRYRLENLVNFFKIIILLFNNFNNQFMAKFL